ncbi:PREDICTED: uncharacterized protein LOC108569441 [Nicrophorus vespilloides]|uniref:Uncharacterized protein LOC108569441 n=1 Tax=Nicrophorus vespilloides TaxID=110193 RepID=A0ABM1NI73_NICVS|nr:PREDICTED: uncharacterized protein LOC108569441 [Nicrophorus vespilloides]
MDGICDRVYLPSLQDGADLKEYLNGYIQREFPDGRNAVYSVPKRFRRFGEEQASLAEEITFKRLHGLNELDDLWLLFVHNVSYGGRSSKTIGKLKIREHDFVLFIRSSGKFHVALIEVKSTHDSNTQIPDLSIISYAKVIKNNKRSAMHQLQGHCEILESLMTESVQSIQQYIFWPFLGALTTDPKHTVIERWKEDRNLHVFENVLTKQHLFNEWFLSNVLNGASLQEDNFLKLMNRYLVLSCGFFVNEIRDGLLALLTQEQLQLLDSELCQKTGKPLVVHGAAGTGKTWLILRKLQMLHQTGKLNKQNRALYICYWPGIKCEVEQKLKTFGLGEFVDTARFYISQTGFLLRNNKPYKHIFIDEAEVTCLVFEKIIMESMYTVIYERYHDGNCDCRYKNIGDEDILKKHDSKDWGELWFLVDINQASLFLPKHSPNILKTPHIVLSKVMRTTGNIFDVFKQFYTLPMPSLHSSILSQVSIPDIRLGHHVLGPPIYWIDSAESAEPLIKVIIDMCSSKGFKPNDVCVLPFLTNDKYTPEKINDGIDKYFVQNGYRPKCVYDVETFVCDREANQILVCWGLRVKGLEFKVVIIAMDDDDFDVKDSEDRKKFYIMASRCTCLLVLISPQLYVEQLGLQHSVCDYPFGIDF